jgi:hypothetical protein
MFSSQEGNLNFENWENVTLSMASDGEKWEIRPCYEVPGRGVSFHTELANLLLQNVLLCFLQGVDMRVTYST